MENFKQTLIEAFTSYWESIVLQIPHLIASILVILFFLTLAMILKRSIRKLLINRMQDPLLGEFLARMTGWMIGLIGLAVAMRVAGFKGAASGILAGAGVGAFIIGFAFKDIGENLLAGIMLAFSRPFNVGDTVEANGIKGSVQSLTLRNTHLKTFDGKDVYIPNGSVIKNNLFNHTIDGFMRHEFTLGIDQDDDYDRAIELVGDVLSKVDGVLWDRRRPVVMLTGTDANSVLVTAYYWVDTFDKKIPGSQIKTNALGRSIKKLVDEGYYLPNTIMEIKNYKDQTVALKNNDVV